MTGRLLSVLRRPLIRPVSAVVLGACLSLVAAGCSVASGVAIRGPYAHTSAPKLDHRPIDEITVGEVAGLGQVLVDGVGMTVYMFQTDRQGYPSRCVGLCAIGWPPLLLLPDTSRPIAGPGIRASLLGTAPRAHGTRQITYNGWPLYTWPQDTAPGEATGQALTNVGGRWYVVNAAGNAVHTY
jgi:predicted lipoprotein with Yx(FWY)xxD motif